MPVIHEYIGLSVWPPLPRGSDATPRSRLSHHGPDSQECESISPRSEALLSHHGVDMLPGGSHSRPWGASSPDFRPTPRPLPHHYGLIADCHISGSNGRHSLACKRRLSLRGTPGPPTVDSRPSSKPPPSCILACCLAMEVQMAG